MNKLYRSRDNRIVFGIVGGIGEYYGLDPVYLRLATFFLGIATGIIPLLLAYLIAVLVIPEAPIGYQGKDYPKLYRSSKNCMVAGVCGGVGEHFDIDPTVIRIVVLALGFMTAVIPILLTYILAILIVPQRPKAADVEIEIVSDRDV